jgi:glycopeptide antibiotics resistance protein
VLRISSFDLLLLVILTAVYILSVAMILYVQHRKGRKPRLYREALKFGFFIYLFLLLRLTIFPVFDFFNAGYISINLIPFRTIIGYIRLTFNQGLDMGLIVDNLLGNILVFIPMGLLVPAIMQRLRRLWKTMLFGVLFSFGIELLQLAFSFLGLMTRSADIDDLILNTVGVIAGFGIFLWLD